MHVHMDVENKNKYKKQTNKKKMEKKQRDNKIKIAGNVPEIALDV